LVRHTSSKYAQRALDKFRVSEIVVQDVAVMVRTLAANKSSSLSVRGSSVVRKDSEPKVHQRSNSKDMIKTSSSSNNQPTEGVGDSNNIPFPLSLMEKKPLGGGASSNGSRISIGGNSSSHNQHSSNFHRRITSTPNAPPPSLPGKNHHRAASDGHNQSTILTDSTMASSQNFQFRQQQQQQQQKKDNSEDLTMKTA